MQKMRGDSLGQAEYLADGWISSLNKSRELTRVDVTEAQGAELGRAARGDILNEGGDCLVGARRL